MYCKKCGWKLNGNELKCPFCNANVTKSEQATYKPISNQEINDGINRDVLGYEYVKLNWIGHLCMGVGMYFAYQLLAVVFILIGNAIGIITKENYEQSANICQIIAEFLCIGVFVYLIRDSIKAILKKFINIKTWKQAGITFVLLYAASFVYNIILILFNYNSDSTNQEAIEVMINETPFLSFLFVCILAPIIEEIIFRFGLFRGLSKVNDKIALALTTFVFAFMHLILSLQEGGINLLIKDLPTLPAYLIGAFAFTYAYYKTKNIAVPICAHFINNTLSFFAILMTPVIENPEASGEISQAIIQLLQSIF